MHKFILDPVAEDELWDIWRFIARDNPDAATCVVEAAFETFGQLAANPGLGRRRKFPKQKLAEIRSWRIKGFENYLIFYRATEDMVHVIHVCHGARDLDALFGHA
jgi:toxin ParE1/3/4